MTEFVGLFVRQSQNQHYRGFWTAGTVWDREINLNELNNLEEGKRKKLTSFSEELRYLISTFTSELKPLRLSQSSILLQKLNEISGRVKKI